MKYEKFRGIVIKTIDYLESDKLLTLLTFDRGSVLVKAKGVRKKGAKLAYGAQQFFCGDFECVESHAKLILTGVDRVYDFSAIASDLDKYYTACHFAEIAAAVIMEDHPDEEMLRMFLNTLHILIKNNIDLNLLISIYEIRTAALAGFAPVMDECVMCGSQGKATKFSIEHGGMVCCTSGAEVDKHVISLIETVSECDMKEMFLVSVPMESLEKLSLVSRKYLETVLDRKFTTIDSINNI
ncbi:MAG: DNA repair protein RecO [Clostridiales bacterium]|nr:DNA repair protein RecO [Clostridiales bacterium]